MFPGKILSLQSHKYRSEHWVIVSRHAKVQIDNKYFNLTANKSIYIPSETLHRLENVGIGNVELIETQIGTYLGEDDIIRYDDNYGRT